jgi:hypothetical protein
MGDTGTPAKNSMKIYLLNGKDPRKSTGGYQTYTYHLSRILRKLKYDAETVCFDEKDKLYNLKIWKNRESAGLMFLGPLLAKKILKIVKPGDVVWGIGPWCLAGAIVKSVRPKVKFLAFYPTTFKHEMKGMWEGCETTDYGWKLKLETGFGYRVVANIYTFIERYFLNKADVIVVHYKSAVNILVKQFGIDRKKFRIIADSYED